MNDNEPAVFTVTELMERWKASRKTVLEAIRAGRLQAFRIGERAYRVTAAEVARYEATKAA